MILSPYIIYNYISISQIDLLMFKLTADKNMIWA